MLMDSGIYDPDYIINFDETGVGTEQISTKTICGGEGVSPADTKHLTVKSTNCEKESTSVGLGGTWTGRKLPGLVILPGQGKGKGKLKISWPSNVHIKFRKEGSYMDRNVMDYWCTYILRPFVKDLPQDKKGLLLLDNFKGHIDETIKQYITSLRVDVETFPSNATKYLQPMDLSVNRPFKCYYSQRWEDYISSLSDDNPAHLTPIAGNYAAPSKEQRVQWISWAWEQVKPQTVHNGFNIYRRYLAQEEAKAREEEAEMLDDVQDITRVVDDVTFSTDKNEDEAEG